ncbi:MAG: S41 family peptidase, partial [Proteobacteria bacterium]|nr:S41 family peptidase [Pseudomonadota bacterium]
MIRAALAAAILAVGLLSAPLAPRAAGGEAYDQLNLFGDVYELVRAQYVTEPDGMDLIYAAITGMLAALDPHSGFMDGETYREMQERTSGEFGGLGIEISVEQGFIKVVAPIEGTPAYRAGILAGDLITHVDGASIEGFTLMDTVVKLRGRPATDVRLTIRRSGAQSFEVTLTRAIIQVQAVRWHAEDDVGYIRVASFNEKVERGIDAAFVGLRNQIGSRMRGVVLDLRNNPGGLLDQSVALADAFLEAGTIVSVRGRDGDSRNYTARAGELARGLPVVVLLNHGSASASEIVAAALQDHGRATLMGSRSFGKGTVQTIMPLPREGALRLTTALYYTPSGRTIQAYGVDPDVEIVGATED